MTQVFKNFMRSIAATGEPSDAALDDLWTELRRLLRRALQRRGLWDLPSSYLGVGGHPAWTTPQTANRRGFPKGQQDALDELGTDFYVEMFVKRLSNLRRYSERGDNLEKVVRLGAGQFIQGRQRENDRLGYRLFQWLRAALARAVARRRVYVLSGSAKIRNDTILGFDRRASAEPASDDALAAIVQTWNDDLVSDWVAAKGSAVTALIGRLEDQVPRLRQSGVEVFGFKALVDAFKRDVRGRLAMFLDDGEGTSISDDPLRPSEERQRIEGLSACVEAAIRDGGGQQRTRNKLLEFWRFLVAFALTAADPECTRGAGGALMAALQRDDLPSHRQLSRLLGIRHDRIPALLARIREEVERCLKALGRSRPSYRGMPGDTANSDTANSATANSPATDSAVVNTDTLGMSAGARGSEARLDKTRDLRQELKRLTAEAYQLDASSSSAATGLEQGALYHLEACPEPGVEWLLVEVDAATGEGLAIPADSLSWRGSSDLAVTGESAVGPLSLRPRLGIWLGSDVLRTDRRITTLAAADLNRVVAMRRDLAADDGAVAVSEVDADPDYRDWCRSLEAARNAMARVYGGRIDETPLGAVASENAETMSWKAKTLYRPLAAAATIAVALGAGTWMSDLYKERARLALQLEIERQPESAVPWLLAPLDFDRGPAKELIVPPEARSIALLIKAKDGDHLEIRDAAGIEVWTSTFDGIDSFQEALVRIPIERMPPGVYGVTVWREGTSKIDFDVWIKRPEPR